MIPLTPFTFYWIQVRSLFSINPRHKAKHHEKNWIEFKAVNQMINLTNPDCGIHWELKTELKASNSSRRSGKSLLNNKIYSNIDCGDLLQAVYHGVVVVQRNISRVSVYIVWHSPV